MEYTPRKSRARDRFNPAARKGRHTDNDTGCHVYLIPLFGFLVVLSLSLFGAQPLHAQQCTLVAGAPACANHSDPGRLDSQQSAPHHVGNPVDVITGNKYQREDDYRAIGSHLSFSRHYNSALVDHNVSLGPGWRHSYHVVLTRIDERRVQIVQSDGRRIVFEKSDANAIEPDVPGADSPHSEPDGTDSDNTGSEALGSDTSDNQESETTATQYRANSRGDGYLVFGQHTRWIIPDGRQMQFYGSFLTGIDFPDNTSLHFHYSQQRLESVTDHLGRTLLLHYTPGSIGPGLYNAERHGPRPGQLETLTLPDGQSIQYGYDGRGNLTRAKHTETDWQEFEYNDPVSPSHMTSRTDGDDHRLWRYDEFGRGIYFSQGNPRAALNIKYTSDGEHAKSGITRVERGDGVLRHYYWRSSDGPAHAALASVSEKACADCKPVVFDYSRSQTSRQTSGSVQLDNTNPVSEPADGEQLTDSGISGEPRHDVLTATSAADYEVEFVSTSGETYLVEANRHAKVTNVTLDGLSLRELLTQADNAGIAICSPENRNAVPLAQRVTGTSGAGNQQDPVCLEQLLKRLDVAEQVEYSATSSNWQMRSGSRQGYLDFCSLPGGRTCAELQYDLEMAMLSQCAYHTGPCHSDWQSVSPQSIGLTDDDFVYRGFAGRLFYHPDRGQYVYAFRGSDEPHDFIEDAIQFNGESTSQYRHAVELSDRLYAILGADLSYTGHSLGGGLATTAALNTGNHAIVFNSAALTPGAADQLSLPMQDANALVDNVVVEGEFVTRQQDIPRIPSEVRLQYIGERIEGNVPLVDRAAPGSRVTIPRPYHAWLQQDEQNRPALVRWSSSLQLHLMSSVIESLTTLLEEACGVPR